MRVAAVALLAVGFVAACWAAPAKTPFDPKWQGQVVIWDFRKNELICHGARAQLVGEELPTIEVGVDAQGRPIRQKFRLLTYNCDEGKHAIRIWMDEGFDLIREVSCHGGKACENKGYDEKKRGNVLACPEGHLLVLKGSEREAK
jgi:hypothetical protein